MDHLPTDVLVVVLGYLDLCDLAVLSRTSRRLHSLVSQFAWGIYLRNHPRQSFSLPACSHRFRVRYNVLADRAWSRSDFVARPLARPWPVKLQSLLAISTTRLVVAAGSSLFSYKFFPPSDGESAPPVRLEGTFHFADRRDASHDITSIAFLNDDRTLIVAFHNGSLERVLISPLPSSISVQRTPLPAARLPDGDFIESLSTDASHLLTLSSSGIAALSSSVIDLQTRSWSSLLSLRPSTPYAAFGTSSTTPLTVHPLRPDSLSEFPSAILSKSSSPTAVYGINKPPPGSPFSPDQTIISGWYDGHVRIYDLRSRSRSSSAAVPTPLNPVLTLHDPYLYEPIYTVSSGGGSGAHVTAGSARNSLLSFWDVRAPTTSGWSVYAPGNDPSPVYSVIMESSRVWGVTQSRPFVLDFGPGVEEHTYPRIGKLNQADTGIRWKKGLHGVAYYVTKYRHQRSTNTN